MARAATSRDTEPGDELTFAHVAEQASQKFGLQARFETIPLDFLGDDEDLKRRFRWFAAGALYKKDMARSRSLVPEIRNLSSWLAAHRELERASRRGPL